MSTHSTAASIAEEFQNWTPLRLLSLNDLKDCGQCAIVYALRDGASREILKYGKTGCARDRFFKNYIGGTGGSTTQRIHAELFENGMIKQVELAWIYTIDGSEAERKEKFFRSQFVQKNGRRPIWDLRD